MTRPAPEPSPPAQRAIAPDPFERFDLSPSSDGPAITRALQERAEQASPSERLAIRAAWESLTHRAERRVELALDALPLPVAPSPPPPELGAVPSRPLELEDLVALPRLTRHLTPGGPAELALDRPRTSPVRA